jgi:hypothetical protein
MGVEPAIFPAVVLVRAPASRSECVRIRLPIRHTVVALLFALNLLVVKEIRRLDLVRRIVIFRR